MPFPETSDTRDGRRMGFPERLDNMLKSGWTEPNSIARWGSASSRPLWFTWLTQSCHEIYGTVADCGDRNSRSWEDKGEGGQSNLTPSPPEWTCIKMGRDGVNQCKASFIVVCDDGGGGGCLGWRVVTSVVTQNFWTERPADEDESNLGWSFCWPTQCLTTRPHQL